MQPRSLISPLAAGLAACAIAPAMAAAQPIDGQAVAAGGGPGVKAQDFVQQNLTAPDQVDRVVSGQPSLTRAPQWPAHPRSLAIAHQARDTSDGDDLDTWVLVAIGGGALAAAGGLGVAGRKLRAVRVRQA